MHELVFTCTCLSWICRDIDRVLREDRDKLLQLQKKQPRFSEQQKKELVEVHSWMKKGGLPEAIDNKVEDRRRAQTCARARKAWYHLPLGLSRNVLTAREPRRLRRQRISQTWTSRTRRRGASAAKRGPESAPPTLLSFPVTPHLPPPSHRRRQQGHKTARMAPVGGASGTGCFTVSPPHLSDAVDL